MDVRSLIEQLKFFFFLLFKVKTLENIFLWVDGFFIFRSVSGYRSYLNQH